MMKDRKLSEQTEQQAEKPNEMDTKPTMTTKRARTEPSLGRDIQAKIGQQLRAYYEGLIEPTPERFAQLLRELDKSGGDKDKPE
jgi:flagellar biosynthesis/type III secretory pathway M-ring protein FliF/YscJ